MEEQIINTSIDILLPVMESAMILAAEYSKACNRTIMTGADLQYALRYCAINITGRQVGSLFPEIYEKESDSDDEEIEIIEENEDDFTRYSGDNELYNKVNDAFDNWDSWIPSSPIEDMLKKAVDKNA
jgi:hypothetical protein